MAEVADYMLPRKSDVNKEEVEEIKKRTDYDSTAVHSLELLASSLHGAHLRPTDGFSLDTKKLS